MDLHASFLVLYQKTENLEGRKRVIGYQLIVIEEVQMRIGDTSGQQGMGVFDNAFEQRADQYNHPKEKGDKGNISDPDQECVSLDSLLARVNVLFARASANWFL